jgi:hypothetical protein
MAQDNRCEIYLVNAHKWLQKCFDGASVLVAKAFFALVTSAVIRDNFIQSFVI